VRESKALFVPYTLLVVRECKTLFIPHSVLVCNDEFCLCVRVKQCLCRILKCFADYWLCVTVNRCLYLIMCLFVTIMSTNHKGVTKPSNTTIDVMNIIIIFITSIVVLGGLVTPL
jgi:hypothetical protein